jgi:diaminohydroxyphosphoribosylaminopyrimidine deaminase/5-amino-6-(5-phosphoribosylamino)uracil reductase
MGDPALVWKRVLELAARGRFSTSPNPRVGAVVLAPDGSVAGEGFHERAGEAHAEVAALLEAGEKARGGTLFVNLEPCAHRGRTPPCADAVIAAGVARVFASLEDPDPRTAGAGIARMRAAGIEVETGGCAADASRLNETFLVSVRSRRPFVHLKWAMSLDGKTAATGGDSKWITGPDAREDSLRLREECDAILVGSGTLRQDDPRLTRRLGWNRSIVPHRRIVLDGDGSVDPGARVFDPQPGTEAWVVTARPPTHPSLAAFRARGVRVTAADAPGGRFDLGALLAALHKVETRSLLVEGGGETAWTFLAAGLADRVTAYVAPSLIGGRSAPTPLSGEGFPTVSRLPALDRLEVEPVGRDLRITGRPSPGLT